jgi:hypothetical protein
MPIELPLRDIIHRLRMVEVPDVCPDCKADLHEENGIVLEMYDSARSLLTIPKVGDIDWTEHLGDSKQAGATYIELGYTCAKCNYQIVVSREVPIDVKGTKPPSPLHLGFDFILGMDDELGKKKEPVKVQLIPSPNCTIHIYGVLDDGTPDKEGYTQLNARVDMNERLHTGDSLVAELPDGRDLVLEHIRATCRKFGVANADVMLRESLTGISLTAHQIMKRNDTEQFWLHGFINMDRDLWARQMWRIMKKQ